MGGARKDQEYRRNFEIKEHLFTHSMKALTVKQLQLLSDIASIQDQVVKVTQKHEARERCEKSKGVAHALNPYFFVTNKDTRAFLYLFFFLAFQVVLQLMFHGHFKYLAPHLPETVQHSFWWWKH